MKTYAFVLFLAKEAVFINVGRANVVSDESLLEALNRNWLSRAIIDVFHQEPLPDDSGLWTNPKLTITPHISALSMPGDIAECFKINFDNFCDGKPLKNLVDWNECY